MTPPKLARDAPVLDVFHPVAVGILKFFGDELDFVAHDGVQGGLGQFGHADPPLQGEAGFDDGSRALGGAYRGSIGFDFDEIAAFFEVGGGGFSGREAIHAGPFQTVLV